MSTRKVLIAQEAKHYRCKITTESDKTADFTKWEVAIIRAEWTRQSWTKLKLDTVNKWKKRWWKEVWGKEEESKLSAVSQLGHKTMWTMCCRHQRPVVQLLKRGNTGTILKMWKVKVFCNIFLNLSHLPQDVVYCYKSKCIIWPWWRSSLWPLTTQWKSKSKPRYFS